MPSPSDKRKAQKSTQDEVRNELQKAVLLCEVSTLWMQKSASLLRHSSELLNRSRKRRKGRNRPAAKHGPA